MLSQWCESQRKDAFPPVLRGFVTDVFTVVSQYRSAEASALALARSCHVRPDRAAVAGPSQLGGQLHADEGQRSHTPNGWAEHIGHGGGRPAR